MSKVRWNISVSAETDQAVRTFLAEYNAGRRGDLSRLVEQAVWVHMLSRTVDDVKARNADLNDKDLSALINEALVWARN